MITNARRGIRIRSEWIAGSEKHMHEAAFGRAVLKHRALVQREITARSEG